MEVPFDPSVRLFLASQATWQVHAPVIRNIPPEPSCTTRDSPHLHLFKCAVIDNDSGKLIQCPFSTNARSEFARHLRFEHKNVQFLCVYCSDIDNPEAVLVQSTLKVFEQAIHLIRHVDARHLNRIFQCPECSYRALTADHIYVHYGLKHTGSRVSRYTILSICKEPTMNFDLKYFYDNYKVSSSNDCLYQCLYCNENAMQLSILLPHLIKKHADLPLMYRLPYDKPTPLTKRSLSRQRDGNYEELLIDNFDSLALDEELLNEHFVCFFCSSFKSSTMKGIKDHLSQHLFNSENNDQGDNFFNVWMNNFTCMQNAYMEEEGIDRELCSVCSFDDVDDRSAQQFQHDRMSLEKQKVHVILHSSFRTIKCLLCAKEDMGDFWLPNVKQRVVDHLAFFHRRKLEQDENVQALELFNFNKLRAYTLEQWDQLKCSLVKQTIIYDYSQDGQQFNSEWDFFAFERLNSQYSKVLGPVEAKIAQLNSNEDDPHEDGCNPLANNECDESND